MIRNFKQILEEVKDKGRKRLAAPAPRSNRVSRFLEKAEKAGLITPVVVGGPDGPVTGDTIDKMVAMGKDGIADIVFQGDAKLQDLVDALIRKEAAFNGLESLSYVTLLELPSQDRIFMLTDTMIQNFPDIRQKVKILENAISFANSIGIEKPKIAALSAAEIVNFAIPSSVDAAILSQMSRRNQLKAYVDGPLDIDSASSREKCIRKGIKSRVAGEADIYFLPDIEAGYSIAEVIIFLGTSMPAGALMGTKFPVVLNPRFESTESLILDVALAGMRVQTP